MKLRSLITRHRLLSTWAFAGLQMKARAPAVTTFMAVAAVGAAQAQTAPQPTDDEAATALWAQTQFFDFTPECATLTELTESRKRECDAAKARKRVEFKVHVEKCGPNTASGAMGPPLPPGAVVCTIALQPSAQAALVGRVAAFYFAANVWNAILY
ncbi:MAG: hypothetical protein JO012_02910 [Hyphomicrobiales bacterium]|nr:hypothetical protein [Hyphomicrobiales bacterium]